MRIPGSAFVPNMLEPQLRILFLLFVIFSSPLFFQLLLFSFLAATCTGRGRIFMIPWYILILQIRFVF